ncbi:gamma-glutamyl AIG2-like cyclotransferase [Agitococcus lubricus]|uniref:Gamma-glutamyl AIG2-like cyclotransferase n=2 Tax=Agitococcus lubricus TaxID=1077255 RepID=A0A2T5IVJ5_9GAMM|nr:gamma-glutamyl AIG2-like cyclotransferase [Agitococcus lubricus]
MADWLAGQAHYIGAGQLKGCLYQVSYYPALVVGEDWVQGDIYACTTEIWSTLDTFEEALGENPEYERRLTPILLATGQWLSAWTYWYTRSTQELTRLKAGVWPPHPE